MRRGGKERNSDIYIFFNFFIHMMNVLLLPAHLFDSSADKAAAICISKDTPLFLKTSVRMKSERSENSTGGHR